VKIDINSYISEDEKKEIAKGVYIEKCKEFFKEEKDIHRILSNTAYNAVDFMIKTINDNKPKIKEIIENNIEKQVLVDLKENLNEYIIDSVQELFKESTPNEN